MKILAVVVRYQTPLSESVTLQGLCDALSSQPDLARCYTVRYGTTHRKRQ